MRIYDVLGEEKVAVNATSTPVFVNAPPETRMISWTCLNDATVVVRYDSDGSTYPANSDDGHEMTKADWLCSQTDALIVGMVDKAGSTCEIFVTYFGGNIDW